MKITIIVDANPIISALIGGVSRNIFFDCRFDFITTKYTFNEVKKYIFEISRKSGVGKEQIEIALSLLPIKIYSSERYKDKLKEAESLIGKIDKKDVNILALTLKKKFPLWSEDKHFEKIENIILIRTKDLL